MEQTTRYLMWSRRKILGTMPSLFNSPIPPAAGGPTYHESWEEQAFAEDSSGFMGGCVWPPRSYTCSFCRREFRSAQALGGHMNVHRRDRARLKQCSSPTGEIPDPYPPQIVSTQVCYTTYPNPNSPPLPVRRLSATLGKRGRGGGEVDDESAIGNKSRRRMEYPVVVAEDGSSGRVEELDLELRLGDPPKVK